MYDSAKLPPTVLTTPITGQIGDAGRARIHPLGKDPASR